jgi:hypothetical protein
MLYDVTTLIWRWAAWKDRSDIVSIAIKTQSQCNTVSPRSRSWRLCDEWPSTRHLTLPLDYSTAVASPEFNIYKWSVCQSWVIEWSWLIPGARIWTALQAFVYPVSSILTVDERVTDLILVWCCNIDFDVGPQGWIDQVMSAKPYDLQACMCISDLFKCFLHLPPWHELCRARHKHKSNGLFSIRMTVMYKYINIYNSFYFTRSCTN